ncbi:hypothetical protein ACNQ21_03095 [Mycoplasma sp. VS299A]|uniref:hypothetical protein n=1 Tax=Mycoplasma sp. VS299A TaxID=3401690 RepID=UPI003AAAE5AB
MNLKNRFKKTVITGIILGASTPLIAISASNNLIVSNELETSKINLKEYLNSLKFQYGIGGFRNIDINQLENMIDSAGTTNALEGIKNKIDEFYGYLTKYYLAAQGMAFGDPYYFLMEGSGLSGTTYNANLWGRLNQPDNKEFISNSYTDIVRKLIGSFFYPNSTLKIWWNAENPEELQFRAKLKQWKVDSLAVLVANGNWNSYKGLIEPVKNINTKLDTPSKEVDNEAFTHVGPIAIMFSMYATMQGNIGGAGHNSYAGWGNATRIRQGVDNYKNLMQELFDEIDSLDPETYKNTNFYKNLNTDQKGVLVNNVINYFNAVIKETKDMKAINSGIHNIRAGRDGSGKMQNLLNQIFGPNNNNTNPAIEAERNRLRTLKQQAASNLALAKESNSNALKALKEKLAPAVYEALATNAAELSNVEDLSANTQSLNNLMQQYENIVETANQYSDKRNQVKYLVADPDKQEAFNNALNAYKNAFLNDSDKGINKEINSETLEQLKSKLEAAYQDLNGESNQEKAIQAASEKMSNFSPEAIERVKQSIKDSLSFNEVNNLVNGIDTYNKHAAEILKTLEQIKKDPEASNLDKLITNQVDREKVLNALDNADNLIVDGKLNPTSTTEVINIANAVATASEIIDNNKWKMTPEEERLYEQLKAKKALAEKLLNNSSVSEKLQTSKTALKKLNNNFDAATYKANEQKMQELLAEYESALQQAKEEYLNAQREKLKNLALPETLKDLFMQSLNETPIDDLESSDKVIQNALESDKVSRKAKEFKAALEKTKNSSNYKLATPEKQLEFDRALKNFSDFLNNLPADATMEDYTNKSRETFPAVRGLNGNDRLNELYSKIETLPISQTAKDDLKSQADALNSLNESEEFEKKLDYISDFLPNKINNLPNLSQKQKEQFAEKLLSLPNVNNLNGLINDANELNNLTGEYKAELEKAKNIINKPAYLEADEQLKTNVDDLVKEFEDNIAQGLVTVDTIDISRGIETLKAALEALNGDQKLQEAKEHAIAKIKAQENLSPEYKNELINQINTSKSTQDINGIVSRSENLDALANSSKIAKEKMDGLKNANLAILSENAKEKYNQVIAKYDELFSGNLLNINVTSEQLNELQRQIAQASQAINSDVDAFEKQKQQAAERVKTLLELSDAQKSALIEKINASTNFEQLNEQEKNANDLNDAISTLKATIKQAREVKNQVAYNEASETIKNDFNNKTSDAELDQILQQAKDSLSLEEITQASTKLQDNIKALDGDKQLQDAKDNANSEIEKLNSLSNQQKEILAQLINESQTIANVNEILNDAKALETSLNNFNDQISSSNELKNTPNYLESDSSKQEEFNKAINDAKTFYGNDKNDIALTSVSDINNLVAKINNQTQDLQNAENILNGNSNLQKAKSDAISQIRQNSNIATDDQNSYEAKINNATSKQAIKELLDQVDAKVESIKELIKFANEVSNYTNSNAYKFANEDLKTNFDQALKNIQTDSKNNFAGITTEQIKELQNNLQVSKNSLNGENNLQAFDNNINKNLANLTNQVKTNFIQQSKNLNSLAELNVLAAHALDINAAAKELLKAYEDLNSFITVSVVESRIDKTIANEIHDSLAQAEILLNDARDLVNTSDKNTIETMEQKLKNILQQAKEQLKDSNPFWYVWVLVAISAISFLTAVGIIVSKKK